ncbi:hypothetical protein BDP55DRAFT_639457 [Colletotrichum godetiae]|uniref:Uncharacterized protein n=1 Tax=Colletotrichum godetiae TaxID=1209918 RepID=A0AAJ0EPH7_9PEZI|nr:uncharacterized protein BDP55DRAFT_639457 [Colletotrichum godetiae]KAK1656629.1 hypothetical protein BDP55DRAFT_639457 [Colletotrichum godetiae]
MAIDESLCALFTMGDCVRLALSVTPCALSMVRIGRNVGSQVNPDGERKRRTGVHDNARTMVTVLMRDPRILDSSLRVRGEQTDQVGCLPAPTPAMSLGGLFAMTVVDALEACCPSSMPLIGVSGEDGGELFLHGSPRQAKIVTELCNEIDLLYGVGSVAVGMAAWAAGSTVSAWRQFATLKVSGKSVRAAASDSRQLLWAMPVVPGGYTKALRRSDGMGPVGRGS